jgi:hypothetical protein
VFAGGFSLSAERYHVDKHGLFLVHVALAIAVVDGEGQARHGGAILRIAQLRIAGQIAE